MKFFKEGDNWIVQQLGSLSELTIPAGYYVKEVLLDDNISIFGYNTWTNVLFKDVNVTEIEKNRAGDFYIDMSEFNTATADFFVNASGDGGVTPTASGGFMYLTAQGGIFGSTIGTFVKLDLPMTAGILADFSYSANGRLTYIGSSSVTADISTSVSLNSNSGEAGYVELAIFKNGSLVDGSEMISYYDQFQGRVNTSICETSMNTNDYIEVYAANVSTDNHGWYIRNIQSRVRCFCP